MSLPKVSIYRASNCTTTLIEHDNFDISEQMNLLRLVRFLYMIRWPHSRQRMGSRGFISFFALQSMFHRCSPKTRDWRSVSTHQHKCTPYLVWGQSYCWYHNHQHSPVAAGSWWMNARAIVICLHHRLFVLCELLFASRCLFLRVVPSFHRLRTGNQSKDKSWQRKTR